MFRASLDLTCFESQVNITENILPPLKVTLSYQRHRKTNIYIKIMSMERFEREGHRYFQVWLLEPFR